MSDAADKAVAYLLQRIKDDPRVAYHFSYTESLARLTRAHALAQGLEPEAFHRQFEATLRTEGPRCRSGECYQTPSRRDPTEAFDGCRLG